jgi:hypothetical protein
MRHKSFVRILALDLHPRRFGYAVLEAPDSLLDWGVRSCRKKGKPTDVLLHRRLRQLLDLWKPTVLVIRTASRTLPRQKLLREKLLEGVTAEAKNYRTSVRKASDNVETSTKYESARRVAEHFPVLARSLPPLRKPWESEDYRMSMFTAATLAIAELKYS